MATLRYYRHKIAKLSGASSRNWQKEQHFAKGAQNTRNFFPVQCYLFQQIANFALKKTLHFFRFVMNNFVIFMRKLDQILAPMDHDRSLVAPLENVLAPLMPP